MGYTPKLPILLGFVACPTNSTNPLCRRLLKVLKPLVTMAIPCMRVDALTLTADAHGYQQTPWDITNAAATRWVSTPNGGNKTDKLEEAFTRM